MVSIFIWKADKPLDSASCHTYLHYYHGVDWFLEERSDTEESASYQWIHQVVSSDYIYYAAKKMGTDWMGYALLEEMEIPYKRWKEEGELCLEQLGIWNRIILPSSLSDKTIEDQWKDIQQWITHGVYPVSSAPSVSSVPSVFSAPSAPSVSSVSSVFSAPFIPHTIHPTHEYPRNNYRGGGRGRGQERRAVSSYPAMPYHKDQGNDRNRYYYNQANQGERGRDVQDVQGGRGGRGGQGGRGGRGRGRGQGRGGRVNMSI